MLTECSECKHQVAEGATKCPKCGHRLPASERQKFILIGAAFVAFALLSERLLRIQISKDTQTFMLILGCALMLITKFGKGKL